MTRWGAPRTWKRRSWEVLKRKGNDLLVPWSELPSVLLHTVTLVQREKRDACALEVVLQWGSPRASCKDARTMCLVPTKAHFVLAPSPISNFMSCPPIIKKPFRVQPQHLTFANKSAVAA